MQNNKENVVMLATTTLHLFDAIIIAKTNQNYNYYFFYLDQKTHNDIYFRALKEWQKRPFKNIDIFVTIRKNAFSKLFSKRRAIKNIFKKIDSLKPIKLIVGNDRNSETSASILKYKKDIQIEYMDEGIHSYKLEKSSFFKYTFLDSLYRSIIYNALIYTPKFIGTSKYIKKIYLLKPELRHKYLKDKETQKLDVKELVSNEVKEFISNILRRNENLFSKKDILNLETTIFLPHPKTFNQNIIDKLISILKNKKNIAVKLHPKDEINSKKFQKENILTIPNSLSAEVLFLSLKSNVKIVSFNSTVLLIASWLREDLKVYNIKFEDNELTELMKKNSIESITFKRFKESLI